MAPGSHTSMEEMLTLIVDESGIPEVIPTCHWSQELAEDWIPKSY
jgi:hypothetical protein